MSKQLTDQETHKFAKDLMKVGFAMWFAGFLLDQHLLSNYASLCFSVSIFTSGLQLKNQILFFSGVFLVGLALGYLFIGLVLAAA